MLQQAMTADFMEQGHFTSHIRRMRQCYRESRDILVDARRKAGLSQRQVAARLGRHQSYVAHYESGRKRRILLAEFVAIARALGKDPTRLLRALMRKMRALPLTRGGRIPAIALTALDTREARRASAEAGFHYHLTKPVNADKLVDIVAALVRLTGA